MKMSARAHGVLDYATVVIFALAPTILGLAGLAAAIAYALAGIHLVMTLLTDFPGGIAKLVPFPLHGVVEGIVSPVLVVLPFVLGFEGTARVFYIVMGVVIALVGFGTSYRRAP